MKRRHVLGALGLSALGAASFGGLGLAVARGQTGELLRSLARLPRPYTVSLPVPSVARPAGARYRLRLLNASNTRRYRLSLDPPRTPLTQVGSDGGLLERPLEHAEVLLAPGERCEIVVDFAAFAPGAEVTMRNRLGTGNTRGVMRFRVTHRAGDDSRVPQQLSRIEPLRPDRAVRTRTWTFRRAPTGEHPAWLLNDRAFDPGRIDADVRLGEVEIWRFTSDLHHPVHVHLDPFQVLSRRGSSPGPYDTGWKDTVDLAPSESVDVAVRFTDYPGRYLLHCHNVEHEDMAMMAAFRTS